MKTVQSIGKKWLVGVPWKYVPATLMIDKSWKTLLSEDEKSFGIPHLVGLQDGAGLLASIPKEFIKQYTLSPLIARSLVEGILVAPIEEGLYWVIAFLKGVPLEGHDLVVPAIDLDSTLNLWVEEMGGLQVYGDHERAGDDRFVLWEDMRHYAKGAFDDKPYVKRQQIINREQGSKHTAIVYAIVVCVLGGAGYFIYQAVINEQSLVETAVELDPGFQQREFERIRTETIQVLRAQAYEHVRITKADNLTMASQSAEQIIANISKAEYEKPPGATMDFVECNRASSSRFSCFVRWNYPGSNSSVIRSIYESSSSTDPDGFAGKAFQVDLDSNSGHLPQISPSHIHSVHQLKDEVKVRKLDQFSVADALVPITFSPSSLVKDDITLEDPEIVIGEALPFIVNSYYFGSFDLDSVFNLIQDRSIIRKIRFSNGTATIYGDFLWLN